MSLFHPKHADGQNAVTVDDDVLLQSSFTSEQCRDRESPEERSPRRVRATRSFQPKRVSELPPLESESESDEDNNLNCAILNDSFLLTPSKCIDDITSSQTKLAVHPRNENQPNKQCQPAARIKLESKLVSAADAEVKRVPLVERAQIGKGVNHRPTLSPTKSLGSHDSGICSNELSSMVAPDQKPSAAEMEAASVPTSESSVHAETHKSQFVTPRLKFPLAQIRGTGSRVVTSTAVRKMQNTPSENELKPQKILFATPMTITRPHPLSIANDFGFSFVDTPKMNKELKALSPIREQPQRPAKRSNEQLLSGVEATLKRTSPEKSGMEPKGEPQHQPKERPITINGKEYLVIKKLGSGGSSSVFLAKQVATGTECAVKLVNLSGDPNLVEGYINETKLLAKLQTNENVIALYDYAHIPEAGQLFLVMEKGDCDLHKILQGYQTDIPLYTLMNIWYQMVQCVHYIHANDVIHLDLKPANFLMINGRLKLIDFGIATNIAYDSTSIVKFSQAGTFNYISPEALIDTSTDVNSPSGAHPRVKMSKKSDIWSLGCILYLLLYKRTPFSHIKNVYQKVNVITNPNTLIEYPPLPSYYPAMLLDMLKCCLRYDTKSRASTRELLLFPFDMVIPLSK